MKKFISFQLVLVFLLSSFSGAFAQTKSKKASSGCENGECIEGLVKKLENLSKVYRSQCLPKNIKQSQIEQWHEEHGFTEECWKYITEINHLESQLQKHKSNLESRLGCENGECKSPKSPGDDISSQLNNLAKLEQQVSCTEPKKAQIRRQCPSDMTCVMMSTALGVGGYLAELLVPENSKPKGCHLGNDSCVTQLATGFLKAAFTFFEGAWDLLKLAGKKTKEALGDFWNWVTDAEDHSSTSQLAMAKASQDEGVFDMLVNDFPGTMKKIWQALVASITEWLKTDIFCQKWSGVPHFSQCLQPTDSFDCIPCKTMVSGLCAVTGTLVAEVVPAFLTGGLLTAAKHGVNGASKIAKVFKVSSKGLSALKKTKLGQTAVATANKADDVLRLTKSLQVAKTAINASLKAINAYMLSPARKLLKTSFGALATLAKKGKAFVAVTPTGKVLVFSGKALKTTGKVVLYPIDNPLTTAAFKSGQRSFDKLFKLGSPQIAATSSLVTKMAGKADDIEATMAKLELARMAKKTNPEEVARLEAELLEKIKPHRQELLSDALDDKEDIDHIIHTLYPELQYSSTAKAVGSERVLEAERELWSEISKISDEALKNDLITKYHIRVTDNALRKDIVPAKVTTTPSQVINNSSLSSEERFKEAMIVIKRTPASNEEAKKLAKALDDAHLHGNGEVYGYTWRELREKYRILTEGGFTEAEADEILRLGLAGRPPVRELIQPGETLFHGFASDIVDGKYMEKREELLKLIAGKYPAQKNRWNIFQRKKDVSDEAQTIIDNLESQYFIDYQHSIDEFDNILAGTKTVQTSNVSQKYEKLAFDNFKETRNWLLTEKPEVNKETLLNIHKRMLEGGVEDAKPQDLGIIRDGAWGGNVPPQRPVDSSILKEINENPYLTWVEKGTTAKGHFYGLIYYPNADYVRPEALSALSKKHPSLVREINQYQTTIKKVTELQQKMNRLDYYSPEYKKLADEFQLLKDQYEKSSSLKLDLTRRLTDAMVDDLMDWFTRERTLIGDIDSPEKLDAFVNILAKFQRDLVSIHPLANGNGRSTRELMNYILMREGLPPAKIIDTNADIYNSLDDWKKIIKHGILASDFLMDDLIERLKFDLPIENSVDLITPYTRPPVKMALKGEKKVPHMDGVEYIDPRLYREIIKRLIKTDPSLKIELTSSPIKAWDKIHKKADEVFAKNNIYYKHPKNGIERVEIGYVDDDFKLLYGKSSYDNQELFDFKMKTWYSDDINWRGLASRHEVKSEEEILGMFKELNSHMASNAVLKNIRGNSSPEAIRNAALADFEKYNEDVFGEGLVQMARDHSETGPMYGISYGYSTSKNREVGKAFSMGAMVIGKYGEHKAPELQALLKSRVLVGARKSIKDVDLGRLKQVRPEFSYKYGRQQEVMGVGASDPDAITIIQTIDAEGEVMVSYLRNPKKADEIWVIKGDIDPDATPTDEQIIKTVTLTRK